MYWDTGLLAGGPRRKWRKGHRFPGHTWSCDSLSWWRRNPMLSGLVSRGSCVCLHLPCHRLGWFLGCSPVLFSLVNLNMSTVLSALFQSSNLKATDERRTKEYKTSQMRLVSCIPTQYDYKILIAPSNSPLQYPAHGFSVVPLKITSIPGMLLIIMSYTVKLQWNKDRCRFHYYINSQVTITTKTFLRYKELRALIKSIRRRYPDMKIIIADDNFDTEKVEGPSIEQYFMPPSQGWFAGRNLAVSQVTTKYFLWVDDDYEFLDQTNIEKFVEIMEAVPDLDVVIDGGRFYFTLEYEEGDEEEGGCLSRNQGGKYHNIPGFDHCFLTDGVVNFFLARTDSVRKVGFDPQLRRVAHSEFFMDGLGKLMVASCNGFAVGHQTRQKNAKYDGFRHPGQTDTEFKLAHHYFKNHLKCVKY
uniref:Glycosyltransferase 2-like domain-containing protein n=1 Tax=Denticeps clupeoides TaxID=299321 RepID=A0A8C4CCY5_9TELE